MTHPGTVPSPSGHTAEGGVLIGQNAAPRLLVFEDAQCPFCQRFERACADLLSREVAAGALAVEYRMRSFLGPESVRAANALALAAEAGRFDQLRREVFEAQPREHSGGYTADDLIALGQRVGLTDDAYVDGVRQGRYDTWVRTQEEAFLQQDPDGTPMAWLDGHPVDQQVLYDQEALRSVLSSR